MTAPTVFLDACVLFPPLVRGILLEAAAAGLFRPRWSDRVLDEWRIAVARQKGPGAEAEALAIRARMAADFPDAAVPRDLDVEAVLSLPDPADAHVAAAAKGSDILLTFNLRDFPRRTLAGLGLEIRHPDGLLWELWSKSPEAMEHSIREALASQGVDWVDRRSALKRARLPRLGKALDAGSRTV